jgi:phosphoribosylformylglycinamidine cyclo-ligase
MRRTAYAGAGVDVAAGDRAVDLLRARLATSELDLLGGIGGFGAALALPPGYSQPVLVTATDGVGTKTEIARELDRLDTIGQDLVAMCADDVVCHGARPTFFLDYLAVGRVEPERVARLVGGIAAACEQIGCALVGGETAEHPGVMAEDAFDLAGFCIGLVERERLIDGSGCRAGDIVVGLASSGLHANGFSLVRALIARHRLDLRQPFGALLECHRLKEGEVGGDGRTLGDELLTPTRLYAPAVLALLDEIRERGLRVGAVMHVTGGGVRGNLTRGLPTELGVRVRPASWSVPPIIELIATLGGLDGPELRATFNCGVGMAFVVEPAAVEATLDVLARHDLPAWVIGDVRPVSEIGPARYVEIE